MQFRLLYATNYVYPFKYRQAVEGQLEVEI